MIYRTPHDDATHEATFCPQPVFSATHNETLARLGKRTYAVASEPLLDGIGPWAIFDISGAP